MSKKKYEKAHQVKSISELLEHDFFIMSMPKSEKNTSRRVRQIVAAPNV